MKVICVQQIMLPFHSALPHNLYRNPFTLLLLLLLQARLEDPPFPAGSTVTFELMLPRPAVVTAAAQMWYCLPRERCVIR